MRHEKQKCLQGYNETSHRFRFSQTWSTLSTTATLSGTHLNSCKIKEEKTSKEEISLTKSDFNVKNPTGYNKELIETIKKEPLKGVMYFYEKFNPKWRIAKGKIKNILREVREELYPTKEEIALSDHYCKTIDENSPREFLQARLSTRVPVNKKGGSLVMKEILIFASRFQLKLLEESAYFIDCTFQIVDKSIRSKIFK